MRLGVILRILDRLLLVAGAILLVPLALSLWEGEGIWHAYAVPFAVSAALALLLQQLPAAKNARPESLRRREGFLAVTLGWLVLVLVTAVAYRMSGFFPGFADAFFESMSGFTTTGATVVRDIHILPRSIVFHRAFSHWIGGMGIIVLSVAILPELAVGGMQLFSAESSGIDSDKLAPRIRETARRLWGLYVGITVLEVVLLLFCDFTAFEAIIHSFATTATGGFSSHNASIGGFNNLPAEIVIMVFMFFSGISFSLQYRAIVQREPVRLFQSPEVRLYILIALGAIALISWNLLATGTYETWGEALRYASFQTISIQTTTGFGTADFDAWPELSRFVLITLMLIGACAGSTAGGSKVVRLYVVAKQAVLQLKRLIRPRIVQVIQLGRREVTRETLEGVNGFYLLYFGALLAGALGMTALGHDLVSGFSAAASALNSIGPGLGLVGPTQNYAHLHPAGMYLLSFGMLLGRLEIYTVLVLFSPYFWRRG